MIILFRKRSTARTRDPRPLLASASGQGGSRYSRAHRKRAAGIPRRTRSRWRWVFVPGKKWPLDWKIKTRIYNSLTIKYILFLKKTNDFRWLLESSQPRRRRIWLSRRKTFPRKRSSSLITVSTIDYAFCRYHSQSHTGMQNVQNIQRVITHNQFRIIHYCSMFYRVSREKQRKHRTKFYALSKLVIQERRAKNAGQIDSEKTQVKIKNKLSVASF